MGYYQRQYRTVLALRENQMYEKKMRNEAKLFQLSLKGKDAVRIWKCLTKDMAMKREADSG